MRSKRSHCIVAYILVSARHNRHNRVNRSVRRNVYNTMSRCDSYKTYEYCRVHTRDDKRRDQERGVQHNLHRKRASPHCIVAPPSIFVSFVITRKEGTRTRWRRRSSPHGDDHEPKVDNLFAVSHLRRRKLTIQLAPAHFLQVSLSLSYFLSTLQQILVMK